MWLKTNVGGAELSTSLCCENHFVLTHNTISYSPRKTKAANKGGVITTGSAELGTGGRRSTLRWLLPFSARVHLPHSTRHQRPSSLRNTTSFQCPSAILHRSRRVVHLPSNSDSRVSTLIPSLSFSDVFVCRHSPNAILTAHFGCRFVFNHPYATLAAGLV